MTSSNVLLLVGFFIIIFLVVIGIIFYALGLARGTRRSAKTNTPPDPNLVEVARLMRDMQTQELIVQMDDKPYKGPYELSPAQLRKLTISSTVLAKWLVKPAPTPAQVEQPATEAATAMGEQSDTPSSEKPAEEVEWFPAESLSMEPQAGYVPPFSEDPTAEVKPVSTQLSDIVGGVLNPTPKPSPEFKSIAMQINDILQARMVGTPFEGRGIAVSDGPDHGVVVTMDGHKFPGVKDVPDEEVRNLIRSAVVEWEKMGKSETK